MSLDLVLGAMVSVHLAGVTPHRLPTAAPRTAVDVDPEGQDRETLPLTPGPQL